MRETVGVDGRSHVPRVLVIPGLNGDPALLLAAAPRLFPGMRPLAFVHRLDLAERGVEGLAERALAVLDADPEGDAPAFVCGESFGGAVALTLARRHPMRVRGLLLLSTFGRYPALPAYGGAAGLALWRLLGARAGGHAFRTGRLLAVPGQLGFRFSGEVARAYLSLPAAHPPAYRAKGELALRFDARPWLDSITCPTLVLVGSWDPVVPTSAGRELARLLPNARLHRLPGGHLAHLVHAAEAGRLIASWAAEQAGRAPGPAAPPDRAGQAPRAPG